MKYCQPTPRSRVSQDRPVVLQLVKKFHTFHGTQRFTAAFKTACQVSLSLATWTQAMPFHPTSISLTSIPKLSSHLYLGFSGGLSYPNHVPTSLLLHTCHVPAQLTILDLITLIISGQHTNHKAPHYAVFSSPLSLPLFWTQYLPQYPILEHQLMFFS